MATVMSFPKESPLPPISRPALTNQNDHTPEITNSSPLDDNSFSSKLTNVEAQRIMSVLQEAQKKVQLVGLIPDVIDRRISTVFGGKTMTLLTVRQDLNYYVRLTLLEQKFKENWDMREGSDKSSNFNEVCNA
jgi:hypothetical protein